MNTTTATETLFAAIEEAASAAFGQAQNAVELGESVYIACMDAIENAQESDSLAAFGLSGIESARSVFCAFDRLASAEYGDTWAEPQ